MSVKFCTSESLLSLEGFHASIGNVSLAVTSCHKAPAKCSRTVVEVQVYEVYDELLAKVFCQGCHNKTSQ